MSFFDIKGVTWQDFRIDFWFDILTSFSSCCILKMSCTCHFLCIILTSKNRKQTPFLPNGTANWRWTWRQKGEENERTVSEKIWLRVSRVHTKKCMKKCMRISPFAFSDKKKNLSNLFFLLIGNPLSFGNRINSDLLWKTRHRSRERGKPLNQTRSRQRRK